MYVIAEQGTRDIRAPRNDVEAAREYRRWIAEIERRGGIVTTQEYRNPPTAADREQESVEAEYSAYLEKLQAESDAAGLAAIREFLGDPRQIAGLPDTHRAIIVDALTRVLDATVAREDAALEAARHEYLAYCEAEEAKDRPLVKPLPSHLPDVVWHLNLWWGGRDYSSYQCQLSHDAEFISKGCSYQGMSSMDLFAIHRAAKAKRLKTAEVQSAKKAQRAIARAARR
jgi:hypothetical protein